MWRGRMLRAWDWLRSRRLVGEDEHHLFYSEFIARDEPERRYVEYKDRDHLSSSDRMHTEWWAWLHHRRKGTPTETELADDARRRAILATRVAQLEADDERNRLRYATGSNTMSPDGSTATAAAEEHAARRRRDVLLGLQRAAMPGSGPPSDALTSPSDRDRDRLVRNDNDDPVVSLRIFLISSSHMSNSFLC